MAKVISGLNLIMFLAAGFILSPILFERQARRQVLEATVQIKMIVPELARPANGDEELEALPIPPDEYRPIARPEEYVVAEGLGTLVWENGRLLLITHDHWSRLSADLGDVRFLNAQGELLVEMDLYAFKQRILFRDGGTLILEAPSALERHFGAQEPGWSTKIAALVGRGDPDPGDELLLAHRQDGRVVVSTVSVVESGTKDGVAILRLAGQTVVNGDSGGGVWGGGQFLGATWTAIVVENQDSAARQATDVSLAALYSTGDLGQFPVN